LQGGPVLPAPFFRPPASPWLRRRHHIENFFAKIKRFRAIATRYDRERGLESDQGTFIYVSNAKMRFQSFFMLITVHPLAFASPISDWSKVPTLVSGKPPAGP